MMREWSSEPPLSWPRWNCSRPRTSEPASRESQYTAALPTPPQPTTMYSNAPFPVPFISASRPGPSVGLIRGLVTRLVLHAVQFVAGLGSSRLGTPLAFVGGRLAERPGHLPDVGCDGAAAGADVVKAEVAGLQGELAHRGAGEGYLLKLIRKLGERDEVGLLVCPVESYRLGSQVDGIGDGGAYLLHQGQHVPGRAKAVGADDVHPSVGQTPHLLAGRVAFEGVGIVVEAHRDHRRKSRVFYGLGGDECFPGPVEGLRDNEVYALPGHHGELAVEELAGATVGLGLIGFVDPRAAQVASYEHVSCSLAGDPAGDPGGLPVDVVHAALEPDRRQLVLAGIESKGLQNVDPGPDELPMQPGEGLGVRDAYLGHEGTGLHVAPALQLQQISTVPEDNAFR